MKYSKDFRRKVIEFVNNGGKRSDASRIFSVDLKTIYNWINLGKIPKNKIWVRQGKINKLALKQHVINFPDMILRERAEHFGVHIHAIWYSLKKMKIRKKNV